jgi:aminoglycoside phosphotransferase (APT) family kinase protein
VDTHPAILRLKARLDWDLAPLLAALRDVRWPAALQHGDFAPWNVFDTGTRLTAIDWEDGCSDGFPWFDLVYYVAQSAFFIGRLSVPRTGALIADALAVAGLAAGHRASLAQLALWDAHAAARLDGLPDANPLQAFRMALARSLERT